MSAFSGLIAIPVPDVISDSVDPHLVHRYKPHHREGQAHHSTRYQHHPTERLEQLGEIPGTDIHDDSHEGCGHHGGFKPDRSQVSMAENKPHDEKDKGQTKQVNVGNTHQDVDCCRRDNSGNSRRE